MLCLCWCCLMPWASPAPARGCVPVAWAGFPGGARAWCSPAQLCQCHRAAVTLRRCKAHPARPPAAPRDQLLRSGPGLALGSRRGSKGIPKSCPCSGWCHNRIPLETQGGWQGPTAGEGEAGAGSPCPPAAITALTSFLSSFSMPLIHPGQMAASQRSRGWQGDGGSALPGGHGPRSPCSAPAHGPGEAAAPVGATWPRPRRGPRRCGGASAHRPGRG